MNTQRTFVQWMVQPLHLGILFLLIWALHTEEAAGFSYAAPCIAGAVLLRFITGTLLDAYWMPVLFVFFSWFLFPLTAAFVFLAYLALLYVLLHLPSLWQFMLMPVLIFTLFAARFNLIHFPELAYLFPYIGSVLMFRLIYFYYYRNAGYTETSHAKKLTYFFQFPNLFFLLYPILDYKQFNSYYDTANTSGTFNRAVNYMYRGLFFALLFRLNYFYGYPDLLLIDNAFDVTWLIISVFLLLFRVMSVFYFSIGLLGLFGYNMPDVFGNFFSATSFIEMWRKINTYWRAFMVKIIYNAVYLKIKRVVKSEQQRLFFSILVTFLISGFFHFYQNYMIQGQSHFKINDAVYWLLFGVLVFFESRRMLIGKKTVQSSLFIQTIKGLFFLMAMMVLFFYWNANNTREFLYVLSLSVKNIHQSWPPLLLLLLLVTLTVSVGLWVERKKWHTRFPFASVNAVWALVFVMGGLLYVFRGEIFSLQQQEIAQSLVLPDALNKRDSKQLEKGYYQKTLDVNNTLMRKWQLQTGNTEWNAHNYATRLRKDVLCRELVPGLVSQFKGQQLTINTFGLRDKEYTREKPRNVIRIALLGGSYEMGSGVGNEEDYESLLEKKLSAYYKRPVEIWNFGLGGYHLIQAVRLTEIKTPQFKFDHIIYVAHTNEQERVASDFSFLIRKKVNLTWPWLKTLAKKAGMRPRASELELEQRAWKVSAELTTRLYRQLRINSVLNHSVLHIWYLPSLGMADTVSRNLVLKQALANQVNNVMDFSDIYINRDIKSLYLAPWDNHPNTAGHKIIANEIFTKLRENAMFNGYMGGTPLAD